MDNETNSEFVEKIVRHLAERPHSQVMVIIDNGIAGLEILYSNPTWVWTFGILVAAGEFLKIKHAESITGNLKELEPSDALKLAIASTKGGVN